MVTGPLWGVWCLTWCRSDRLPLQYISFLIDILPWDWAVVYHIKTINITAHSMRRKKHCAPTPTSFTHALKNPYRLTLEKIYFHFILLHWEKYSLMTKATVGIFILFYVFVITCQIQQAWDSHAAAYIFSRRSEQTCYHRWQISMVQIQFLHESVAVLPPHQTSIFT